MEKVRLEPTVLITGAAGFIGYSLASYISKNTKYKLICVDNMNNYYDTNLKLDRVKLLGEGVSFHERDINDNIDDLFNGSNVVCVVNLAAQAGVRYSRENPDVYIESNVDGFYNLIKTANTHGVKKFIYASSSSVYGANKELPFSESDPTSSPMSLYAATKLANESIASGFHYMYGMRTIGLRFFNIYGPFGRPDMAYFKWTKLILEGKEVELNDGGNMWRDMTYIEDCVQSIFRLIENDEPEEYPEIYNIGNKNPVKMSDLLEYISDETGVLPLIKNVQAGKEEPIKTWANTDRLDKKIGFSPNTNFRVGVKSFLDWYRSYYG